MSTIHGNHRYYEPLGLEHKSTISATNRFHEFRLFSSYIFWGKDSKLNFVESTVKIYVQQKKDINDLPKGR